MKTTTGKLRWSVVDGVHYGWRDEGREPFAQVIRGYDGHRLFVRGRQVGGVLTSATKAKMKAEGMV